VKLGERPIRHFGHDGIVARLARPARVTAAGARLHDRNLIEMARDRGHVAIPELLERERDARACAPSSRLTRFIGRPIRRNIDYAYFSNSTIVVGLEVSSSFVREKIGSRIFESLKAEAQESAKHLAPTCD
jgi:hypothetical protein